MLIRNANYYAYDIPKVVIKSQKISSHAGIIDYSVCLVANYFSECRLYCIADYHVCEPIIIPQLRNDNPSTSAQNPVPNIVFKLLLKMMRAPIVHIIRAGHL